MLALLFVLFLLIYRFFLFISDVIAVIADNECGGIIIEYIYLPIS